MARVSQAQLAVEAAELEEALNQLSAVAGWDYDYTFDLVLTVAGSLADPALNVARWLIRHASEGATITLEGDALSITNTGD